MNISLEQNNNTSLVLNNFIIFFNEDLKSYINPFFDNNFSKKLDFLNKIVWHCQQY